MFNKKIVVLGSSGHAKSIIDILETLDIEIVGFLDSFKPVGQKILRYKILGGINALLNCEKKFGTNNLVVGIGDNQMRKKIVCEIKTLNNSLFFPSIVSPRAYVSKYSSVGEGSIVFNGSFINVESNIGRFCVVNSGCIVEHNTIIEDYCNLSPGVNSGGNVKISESTFVGSSATIIQKITIGQNVVVGAGAVVTENLPDSVLAVGIPAKIKKTNYLNPDLLK